MHLCISGIFVAFVTLALAVGERTARHGHSGRNALRRCQISPIRDAHHLRLVHLVSSGSGKSMQRPSPRHLDQIALFDLVRQLTLELVGRIAWAATARRIAIPF